MRYNDTVSEHFAAAEDLRRARPLITHNSCQESYTEFLHFLTWFALKEIPISSGHRIGILSLLNAHSQQLNIYIAEVLEK